MDKEDPEYERVRRVKESKESFLLAKEGVLGCSVGYKQVAGKKTEKLAIICMVKKKQPRGLLSEKEVLPGEIEGVPIDVVEVGEIESYKKI